MPKFSSLLLLLTLIVAACAPAPRGGQGAEGSQATQPAPQRPLSIALRNEPFDLTDSASSRNRVTQALFTGQIGNYNERDVPYPVLAEALPSLNTDSWRVLPDGRMETTYRLKPNLTWHDGTPLSAEDFVFTRTVNLKRFEWGLSVSSINPVEHRIIEDMQAPDARTLVIRWRQPYPEANTPDMRPVPRHILEAAVEQGNPELLGSHPYWTTEYVGLGPFRVTRWERGAFIDGAAFEGYALGRPKIDRVRVTWSSDPNTTMVQLLAGAIDIAMDDALQFQQAASLRREWAASKGGTVLLDPRQLRHLQAQHRPAYASPAAILDPRVRRAVAHAIDRKSMADAILEGEGLVAETIAPPTVSFYSEVERTAPKYPYDLRRTEALLGEVGLTKGADGFFASPTEGRVAPEVFGIAEGQEGQESTVVVDFLRRAGIDASLRLAPAAQVQQSDEMKATFPALRTNYTGTGKDMAANRFLGSRAAAPENRWGGTNKIGWSNAEHDRLYDEWTKTLDRADRTRLVVQIVKIHNEELPAIPMYFNFEVQAHVAGLWGPHIAGLETTHYGNISQWEWR